MGDINNKKELSYLPTILRGFVHPLQDIALSTVLSSFSLSGISSPCGSFPLSGISCPGGFFPLSGISSPGGSFPFPFLFCNKFYITDYVGARSNFSAWDSIFWW
ncbi:hypothetical protein ElyMa_006733500 [Elysia marginata]|uniref:Uncharacterized protein n=1 Tax=Elysia marginata TaxID=1093978 RepID=A0AAV4ITT8_9GAST|nr:hypothetical protein ElyMa_006733500 [Elysia marginata]